MARRQFIFLLLWIFMIQFSTKIDAQKNSPKDFILYNALLLGNTPDLTSYGLHKFFLFYEAQLLDNDFRKPDDYSRRLINGAKIDSLARKAKKNPEAPVCLDIESWSLDEATRGVSLPKYLDVLQRFKEANNISKVGYFEIFPHDPPLPDYWYSAQAHKTKTLSKWHESNNFVKEVGKRVDIFYPAFYTRNQDTVTWRKMVQHKIAEIKNFKKTGKIYGFLWPQYYLDNGHYKFIESDIWRFQLEILYKYCDGIVIWSHYNGPEGKPVDFDYNMDWFKATRQFIQAHNIK